MPLAAAGPVLAMALLAAGAVDARSPGSDATGGMTLFADNCFSPFLTAAKAKRAFNLANLRHDFYDLDPFSDVAPSPATSDVTPGTDRRCEVAFDGDYGARAAERAVTALAQEGILTEAALPETHEGAAMDGTILLAARQLNPKRIAVVHVGTRPGPDGIETFMTVERLRPQQ
ncbi:MAG: succinyl-CoA synthetase subunit beta [Boseongicola sp.]|nr:succinyl-CoA synthetase subunit beta [Boseongicola sp.]